MADEIEKVAVDQRWGRVIVFAEFWGASSLSGIRVAGEPMNLSLFDVNPYKKGILGPREFLKLFGDNPNLPTAGFLGIHNWTRGFLERVWNNDVPGITFEGAIGKGGDGHDLVVAKAKTRQWIEAITARYSKQDADKILNS